MLREESIVFAAGCADNGATAQKTAANWDRFLGLTFAENDTSVYPDPLLGRPVEPWPFDP